MNVWSDHIPQKRDYYIRRMLFKKLVASRAMLLGGYPEHKSNTTAKDWSFLDYSGIIDATKRPSKQYHRQTDQIFLATIDTTKVQSQQYNRQRDQLILAQLVQWSCLLRQFSRVIISLLLKGSLNWLNRQSYRFSQVQRSLKLVGECLRAVMSIDSCPYHLRPGLFLLIGYICHY